MINKELINFIKYKMDRTLIIIFILSIIFNNTTSKFSKTSELEAAN